MNKYIIKIQLTESSEWITETGESLSHVLLWLGCGLDFKPYAYIKIRRELY